jgi:hypothetical protein
MTDNERDAYRLPLLLAVALWFFATMLARAEVRILASPGGQGRPVHRFVREVRNSGERVAIDWAVPVGLHPGAEHAAS